MTFAKASDKIKRRSLTEPNTYMRIRPLGSKPYDSNEPANNRLKLDASKASDTTMDQAKSKTWSTLMREMFLPECS